MTHFAFQLTLIVFATTLLRGILGGGGFEATMESALALAAISYGLGFGLGHLTCWVIEEHVDLEFAHIDEENAREIGHDD